MQPKLTIIDNLGGLALLEQALETYQLAAYDTETTGTESHDKIIGYSICGSAEEAFYVILYAWDAINKVLNPVGTPEYQKRAIDVIRRLTTKHLLMHNAPFDCKMTNSNFKVELIDSLHTDTMILAHVVDENRPVGLKELAKQYLGETATQEQAEMRKSIIDNGGNVTKASYELYKADARLIAKYGAKDAWLTYMIFFFLIEELEKQNLSQFFYDDESMPLLKGPTYQLNTTGLQVDMKALLTLKKTLQAEIMEAKDFISTEIAPLIAQKYPGTNKRNTFNIGASQQLSWLLFDQLELEFQTLTAAGKTVCKALGMKLPYSPGAKRQFMRMVAEAKGQIWAPEAIVNGRKVSAKKVRDPWVYIACDKKTLTKLAPKYKWIAKLLEFQKKSKILTTYVEGIESRVKYGVIYPSFLQHGTTSGRYSSRNPNFQNLPRDDKRVKACITARNGRVFVGADYSQLEPRVFAFFSGDARLLEVFKGAEDFYSAIGIETFDKYDATPFKEGSDDAFGIKYKRLRDISKVIALSTTYGSTAHKLSGTIEKSVEETQDVIDRYFEKFPGVKKMMLEAHEQAKTNGAVYNYFGRPRRMPEAKRITKVYGNAEHADLPYEARNLLNLAVNHRIQSTGASIVNRAAIRFNNNIKELGIDAKLVVQVHDSLVIECLEQDAETVSLLLQDAMENTVELPGVRLEALPKIGRTLADV